MDQLNLIERIERKKSDDSEISESSMSARTAESKSQPDDISEVQKKNNALKKAVNAEKQEKESAIKLKHEMEAEIEKLKAQIQEKDSYCIQLKKENADLQDKLQTQNKKTNNTLPKFQPSGQGAPDILGLLEDIISGKKDQSEELEKFLVEYNYMIKQLEVLFNKYTKSEESLNQVKRESRREIEKLQKRMSKLERDLEAKSEDYVSLDQKYQELTAENKGLLEEKTKIQDQVSKNNQQSEVSEEAYLNLSHKYQDLMTENQNLLKEKVKVEDELQNVRQQLHSKGEVCMGLGFKCQDLMAENENLVKEKAKIKDELLKTKQQLEDMSNEKDELEKSGLEKVKKINEMNEELQKMETEILNLNQKINSLTIELEESAVKLQVFDVKKVSKVGVTTPAQILLRKNIIGENIIEVENAGERISIYPELIQSFGLEKETEDKFYIEFKNTKGQMQRDLFISTERKKVLKHLITLMKRVKESKITAGLKGNALVERNILSQMISFFGN